MLILLDLSTLLCKTLTGHKLSSSSSISPPTSGKVCKNLHGLKIHQTKMKCLTGMQVVQRAGPVPDEMQEEAGRESTHSAQTLHAPQALPRFKHSEHRRVMWPAANKEGKWLQFDEDLDQVLDATARGDADQKLLSMSAMIISIGAERFGMKEQPASQGSRGAEQTGDENQPASAGA